jgi:hypothetical protein
MPQRMFDRVKETGTGTNGNITLTGAVAGFKTFASRFTAGAAGVYDPVYYCITDSANNWEVGKGYLSTASNFVRDVVQASSNADTTVTFNGTVEIFNTVPADRMEEIWTKGQTNTLVRGWCMA